eukprot:1961279-Pleurochrysis_carterae.AAC.4
MLSLIDGVLHLHAGVLEDVVDLARRGARLRRRTRARVGAAGACTRNPLAHELIIRGRGQKHLHARARASGHASGHASSSASGSASGDGATQTVAVAPTYNCKRSMECNAMLGICMLKSEKAMEAGGKRFETDIAPPRGGGVQEQTFICFRAAK